jgi:predicted metal-dependent peptidase
MATFKSFERASMIPQSMMPSTNQNIMSLNLNITLEENNISPLVVNRVKSNFGKHNYIIYSDNQTTINNCLTYIRNISNYPLKEDSFDLLDELDLSKYKKDTIYTYDLRKNDIKNVDIAGKGTLNCVLQTIQDKSEGIIIISHTYDNVPVLISTISNLIFIDKDIKDKSKIVMNSASIRLPENITYELDNMICVNKTSLWSKLALF